MRRPLRLSAAVLCGVLGGLLLAPAPAAPAAPADPAQPAGRTMLLMDSSGSMAEPAGGGQTKIQAARTALRGAIETFPEDAEVGFRVFGAEVFSRDEPGACEDTQVVEEPATGNRDELRAAVDDYAPFGETPIPAALRGAADDLGDEVPRSILLVSDGESNCPPDPCEVAAELREQGIDLRIDVVGLGVDGAARDQLRCIAEEGGGTYYDADDADEIEDVIERAAERAVRPFTLTGAPVEGGTETDPTPIGPGDWTDSIEPDERRVYSVEKTSDDSVLRVTGYTQGGAGIGAHTVELQAPGESVWCSIYGSTTPQTPEVITGTVYAGVPDECGGAAGTYLVTVASSFETAYDYGLRVTEEPGVLDPGFDDVSDEPYADPQVDGRPTEVVGGTSFANAPELGEGRWTSDVVAGEVVLFRVPLVHGEGLRARVDVAPASGFAPTAELRVYSPMLTALAPAEGSEVVDGYGRALSLGLPRVSRARPVQGYTDGGADDVTMAGDYYLAVSLATNEDREIRDLTLDVEVTGEPGEPPTYADDRTWSVLTGAQPASPADPSSAAPDEPGEDPAPRAASDQPSGDTEGGGPPVALLAGAAGVAGLLLVGLGVLVLARRRRP